MDGARAKRITAELEGKHVGEWTVLGLIDYGKSALVLKAESKGVTAALKVFDPDLVERFGKDTQLERIEREKSLIGVEHPNLIPIFDGGQCDKTGHLYVTMKYLPYKNLMQVLGDIPRYLVLRIIEQIASAANFLEERGLAHRDIKPENIAISDDFQQAVLLDLGVLRPVGNSGLTDSDEQKDFMATLQYSPPELLRRDEEDTTEGWRAVTFYQLGAVLHDLIMKRPIFAEHAHPYARLVQAVHQTIPTIDATDIADHVRLLARSCLLKNPEQRLQLVGWQDFQLRSDVSVITEAPKDRILRRQIILKDTESEMNTLDNDGDEASAIAARLQLLTSDVAVTLRNTCTADRECFPRFELRNQPANGGRDELLTFGFGPSDRHALTRRIEILIWVSVTDTSQDLVCLKVKASWHEPGSVPNDKDSDTAEIVFEGPYESNIIAKRIASTLYTVMEQALDLELAGSCEGDATQSQTFAESIRIALECPGSSDEPSE